MTRHYDDLPPYLGGAATGPDWNENWEMFEQYPWLSGRGAQPPGAGSATDIGNIIIDSWGGHADGWALDAKLLGEAAIKAGVTIEDIIAAQEEKVPGPQIPPINWPHPPGSTAAAIVPAYTEGEDPVQKIQIPGTRHYYPETTLPITPQILPFEVLPSGAGRKREVETDDLRGAFYESAAPVDQVAAAAAPANQTFLGYHGDDPIFENIPSYRLKKPVEPVPVPSLPIEKEIEANQGAYVIGDNDAAVKDQFNTIYQIVKGRPGEVARANATGTADQILTDVEFNASIRNRIASLLLSPEYQGSSYFKTGDILSVTSEKAAIRAAQKSLQDWETALDPDDIGDGDSLRWLNVIDDYGLPIEDKPASVTPVLGTGEVTDGVAATGAVGVDTEFAELLEDPSFYQALWQESRGIPASGRTQYEQWLAEQWRTPAINYIMGIDPQIGGQGIPEGLTYRKYLESIEDQPVGGLDPDLVRAFEELDRTRQGSAFERFSTVPGLNDLEQYLYRSTLMEQGIPPWLATNLTQQRYAGQDLYSIGRGLDPGAPSFFSSLTGMNPLAFGSGGSMSATPTATPTSLAMPMDEFVSPFSGLMAQNEDPLTEFVSPFANIV